MKVVAIVISIVFLFASQIVAENLQKAGVWDLERLKTQVPEFRVVEAGRIQSLIYAGETLNDSPTEVFAFYASPKTIDPAKEGPFPGIVLIHGGGGTAFAEWTWLWAQRGYAAIAMDLSGRRPGSPEFDKNGRLKIATGRQPRSRLEKGGLDHTHREKFESIGGRIDDDWPYHAVASVMRAHTLLRSFEEVDENRTAVTGISWGGYTTCLVASLDDRFKAAVPVYGCGFLHEGESVQKPSIDALGDRRAAWVAAYDPSSHLAKCKVPTLWVNGTHDKHYVLDSYSKSYDLVQGDRTIRIEPRMRHGHQPGWAPQEIGIYVDSILTGGDPLPRVGIPEVDAEGKVSVQVESQRKIVTVELHYTSDTGPRTERKWNTISGQVSGKIAQTEVLPANANTWLLTLTDDRGAMVSSEAMFR